MILFREEIVMVKSLNYYDNHVYVHELYLLTLFEESEMIVCMCIQETEHGACSLKKEISSNWFRLITSIQLLHA